MTPYYEDDAVTLYHADCREVLPTLPLVQLVVTSPPYFNARKYANWLTYGDYLDTLREVVGVLRVAPGRMVCLNTSSVIVPRESRAERSRRFNIPGDLHQITREAGLWFQEEIVWEKPEGAAVNRNQRFSLDRHPLQWRTNPCTERILVCQMPTAQSNDAIIRTYGGRDRIGDGYERSDVWRINPATSSEHPAPFPRVVPSRLVRYYSWSGDTVLDPFAGSGTTLVVARDHGRRAIGVEVEERFCELAARQLSQGVLEVA